MGRARLLVDRHVGTTGPRVRELLAPRDDIERIQIGEADRKPPEARRELLNECDLTILCLPIDGAPAEGHPRGLAIASRLGHHPKTPRIPPIRFAPGPESEIYLAPVSG